MNPGPSIEALGCDAPGDAPTGYRVRALGGSVYVDCPTWRDAVRVFVRWAREDEP